MGNYLIVSTVGLNSKAFSLNIDEITYRLHLLRFIVVLLSIFGQGPHGIFRRPLIPLPPPRPPPRSPAPPKLKYSFSV
jgi:hypothetical protein